MRSQAARPPRRSSSTRWRVRLPAAITEVVLGRLILDLERRIRRWRVENGHEHLEVSIHADADDALVHTIAIDPHWLIESGPHP